MQLAQPSVCNMCMPSFIPHCTHQQRHEASGPAAAQPEAAQHNGEHQGLAGGRRQQEAGRQGLWRVQTQAIPFKSNPSLQWHRQQLLLTSSAALLEVQLVTLALRDRPRESQRATTARTAEA